MKRWFSKYWEQFFATSVPLILLLVLIVKLATTTRSEHTVPFSGELLFIAAIMVILFCPLLFCVYRRVVINHNKNEVMFNKKHIGKWIDVSFKRFAISISLLVSTIMLVSGGVMLWDVSYKYQYNYVQKVAGFGMSHLMVGNYLTIPSCVIEWSFLGSLIFILQDMIRRYIAMDLTPKFYFLSTVRIVISISAALLLFSIVQANYPLYEYEYAPYSTGTIFRSVSLHDPSNNSGKVFWLLPICFFAGMFPVQTIASIKYSTETWLTEKLSNFPGKIGKIFNTDSLNIHLKNIVPSENVERFMEEGIYSVQDLALADTFMLARQVPFNISKLIDWQDQAMLLCCIGNVSMKSARNDDKNEFSILSRNGINRFSDLYYLYQISKDSNKYAELKKCFKPSFLLDVLVQKGETIEQEFIKIDKNDVRIAAFKVWHMSPNDIAECI